MVMKVWVIEGTSYFYEDTTRWIYGIFANEEKANIQFNNLTIICKSWFDLPPTNKKGYGKKMKEQDEKAILVLIDELDIGSKTHRSAYMPPEYTITEHEVLE